MADLTLNRFSIINLRLVGLIQKHVTLIFELVNTNITHYYIICYMYFKDLWHIWTCCIVYKYETKISRVGIIILTSHLAGRVRSMGGREGEINGWPGG